MKYKVKFTSRFKKDFKLAQKQKRNVEKLFQVIEILASGEFLDEKYKDHALKGNYVGTRECHIEPDFLLIYEKHEEVLILTLLRLGSHSELF